MTKQFISCPACGALGEVGSACQFCGTMVMLKEGATISTERIPQKRTVTPQQYAEKISIYQEVVSVGLGLLRVSIGKQYGLINLNGDLIYPLGDIFVARVIADNIYKDNKGNYVNLEKGLKADQYGFLWNEKHLYYRVDVKNNWMPINTYKNIEGEVHSYKYAKKDYIHYWNSDNHIDGTRIFYCFSHNDSTYSIYFPYNYQDEKLLKLNSLYDIDPELSVCVLEGIKKWTTELVHGHYILTKDLLKLQTIDGTELTLEIGKYDSACEIYGKWCRAVGKDFKMKIFGLGNILKIGVINKELHNQIINFIQEVKSNTIYNSFASVYFHDKLMLYIWNNDSKFRDHYILDRDLSGVGIIINSEDDEVCSLFEDGVFSDLFHKYGNTDVYYMNFFFDTESLCAVIQYLAEYFECPSDEIKLVVDKIQTEDTSVKQDTSNKYFRFGDPGIAERIMFIIAMIPIVGIFLGVIYLILSSLLFNI